MSLTRFHPILITFLVFFAYSLFIIQGIRGQTDNCLIPVQDQFDCHPEMRNPSNESCLNRHCVFCNGTTEDGENVSYCYLPKDYGYILDLEEEDEKNNTFLFLNRSSTNASYFQKDFPKIKIQFLRLSRSILRIKITNNEDEDNIKEVPLELHHIENDLEEGPPLYNVIYDNPDAGDSGEPENEEERIFSFLIEREETGTPIFDTFLGGLTLSENFLQISVALPSEDVYGIGENGQTQFRHDFTSGKTKALWASNYLHESNIGDQWANMNGVHPYYTVIEDDNGTSHSVLFYNSNAQEFELIPEPGYIYRTIGGILDIFIFMGPTPQDCAEQYTQLIGRQNLPPYWGLGFQLGYYSYGSVENMREVVDRNIQEGFPLDVIYGDVEIWGSKQRVFKLDNDDKGFGTLGEFVEEIMEKYGVKFVPVLETFIPLLKERDDDEEEDEQFYLPILLGNEMNIWINNSQNEPFLGFRHTSGSNFVMEGHFPDFSNPKALEYWTTLLDHLAGSFNFNGLVLTENEPENHDYFGITQCANNDFNHPPYVPRLINPYLGHESICPDAKDAIGRQFDTHSLYGHFSSIIGYKALKELQNDTRPFVLSRSTFVSSGQWTGHWFEIPAEWASLHHSIIAMLKFNLFGIPFSGANICGYMRDASEELCVRWTQLGAFYPLARNYNGPNNAKDPASYPTKEAKEAMKTALEIRYTLLPYFYTLFYEHYIKGSPVIRPMWYEFLNDTITLGIDTQFLVGNGLLVSPVLEERQEMIEAYFPPEFQWFSYFDGEQIYYEDENATFVELDSSSLNSLHIHLRGGVILPGQEPALNTQLSRNNPFNLLIALDASEEAAGYLFYDDGESPDTIKNENYFLCNYSFEYKTLKGTVKVNGYEEMSEKVLGSLRIFGNEEALKGVRLNGEDHFHFHQDSTQAFVTQLNIPMTQDFIIEFGFNGEFPTPSTSTTASTTTTTPSPATEDDEDDTTDDDSSENPTTLRTTVSTTFPTIETTQNRGDQFFNINFSFLIILTIFSIYCTF